MVSIVYINVGKDGGGKVFRKDQTLKLAEEEGEKLLVVWCRESSSRERYRWEVDREVSLFFLMKKGWEEVSVLLQIIFFS